MQQKHRVRMQLLHRLHANSRVVRRLQVFVFCARYLIDG
jgi:hypothetical protein